jgi:D-aminopeptidase
MPGVTRASACTFTFSTQDHLEGVKILRALIALASAR